MTSQKSVTSVKKVKRGNGMIMQDFTQNRCKSNAPELSLIAGPKNQPLISDTLFESFERRVHEYNSQQFIHVAPSEHNNFKEENLSWNEMYELSNRLAIGFLKLGTRNLIELGYGCQTHTNGLLS